jgi:very-short-patch-repair endonuclease
MDNKREKVHNVNQLKGYRQGLRNNPTQAEVILWQALRKGQLHNRKFRRQQSIENYIVDFYCPAEKLIIELDGSPHALASVGEADAKRDARLREMGFKVLRIENKYVLDNLPGILALITSYFAFSVDLE